LPVSTVLPSILPLLGFNGEVRLELHRQISHEDQGGTLRRGPRSTSSLLNQFQDRIETLPSQGTQTQPPQQSGASRPQPVIPSTSTSLVSPHSEVLQRIGRAPQPGILQPMPAEAPASTCPPVEMSADTEVRRPVYQRGPRGSERTGLVEPGVGRGSSSNRTHQVPDSGYRFSSVAEPTAPAAPRQQSQRPPHGPPIADSSPLTRLLNTISSLEVVRAPSVDSPRPEPGHMRHSRDDTDNSQNSSGVTWVSADNNSLRPETRQITLTQEAENMDDPPPEYTILRSALYRKPLPAARLIRPDEVFSEVPDFVKKYVYAEAFSCVCGQYYVTSAVCPHWYTRYPIPCGRASRDGASYYCNPQKIARFPIPSLLVDKACNDCQEMNFRTADRDVANHTPREHFRDLGA